MNKWLKTEDLEKISIYNFCIRKYKYFIQARSLFNFESIDHGRIYALALASGKRFKMRLVQ
ncbi:MAG: hypothetical protein QW676_00415 [Candidatus Aenigmatarchaeota archaeon]